MKKMIFCLKFGIFQFKKPKFTVHLTNLTSISLFYKYFNMWRISDVWRILDFLLYNKVITYEHVPKALAVVY